MEDALELVIVAVVGLSGVISVVGAFWGFFDSIATPSGQFRAAGRNKWVWMLFSLIVPYVGVYYVCVVRRELKGKTFPRWVADAALWFGAILAVAVVASAAAGVAANYALGSGIAIAIVVYLGLHPEDWTGKATPVVV